MISAMLLSAFLVGGHGSTFAVGSCGFSTGYSSTCSTGYAVPTTNLYIAPTATLADPYWEYAVQDRYQSELRLRQLEALTMQLAENNASLQAQARLNQASSYVGVPQAPVQSPPTQPLQAYGPVASPQATSYIGDPNPARPGLAGGSPEQIFQSLRCLECHSPQSAASQGGGRIVSASSDVETRLRILRAVGSGHMPPAGYPRPTRQQFDALWDWAMQAAVQPQAPPPGGP